MRKQKSTMASGEREQILADFQACTQLDDIETCIAILDQHDWNLMQAVQNVMADSPTVGVPPPSHETTSIQVTGEGFFSSGIFSDPVPRGADANVMDAATSFDPGSASGPGPSTSSGAGFSSRGTDKRMLHFTVEYREKNVDVFMADTETVAQIKDTLSIEFGVPVSKMVLKGWANRKVFDNSVLRELHLPKENTLFMLTPDLTQGETTAGTSASASDTLNRNYNLKVTVKEGTKYEQTNLKFPGTKTVEESYIISFDGDKSQFEGFLKHCVKRDVYNVSDIPVRHQVWTGWPENTIDSMPIGAIGLSYPNHMLELTKSNLSSRPRTAQEVAREMELSDDEEDEDFQEGLPTYEDSELFSHDDRPSRRKQDPLISETVNDEFEALESFTREFRERYGECHPVFYVGSLDNAIKDSILCPAKERKLLAIYLHHDSSILSNVFCSQIFCNESIVNYLTSNFITWAWDMTFDTNATRLISMATRHFGSVAANQIRGYSSDNYPMLLIISRSRATNEVVDVIRGDVTVDELMIKLIQDHEVFSEQRQRDVVEEAERDARSMIRNQQDEAYQLSLEADRKKAEAKQEEERKQQEEERRERQKKEREEREKMKEEAMKQAIEENLAKKVPDEPPEGCQEVTCTLRIRTPTRETLTRKFYGRNKLAALFNYITSKGFHLEDHKLLCTFPRRDLSSEDSSQTLEELRLCPQETLIIEARV